MMRYSQQRPTKVKVTVVDDEKLPGSIDLGKEIRRGEVTVTKQASETSEPDWRERYLRLAADLENTKKRLTQTYKRQAEQEKERLLTDFLEVSDNLERALAHADAANPEALIEGMQAIQRQFQQTLLKHQVRPFDVEGQPFDPERHEAVSTLHRPDLPPSTVVQVSQTGYTIGDRLLRPARVVVTGNR